MPAIDQIVNVVISLQGASVPQAGFGIPLILGSSSVISPDLIRYYSSTSAMLADGWVGTEPEYLHAVRAFAQDLSPLQVAIGRRSGGTMAADIAAIQNAPNGNAWYGLVITSKVASDILAAAAYIETQKKIFIACSADANVLSAPSGDVISQLKALNYNRTGTIYTKDAGNAANGPDAAWVGGQLPQTPGSSTWKFKQLNGINSDSYTDTERNKVIGSPPAAIVGKNGNIYESVGGVKITEEGWMASGRFIDVTVGVDWLQAEIQTNIYALLVGNPKIPYTDQGASVIYSAVQAAIKQGITNGLIDGKSAYTISTPPVLGENPTDRANRFYPDVTFECRFAGAFHFVKVTGTVTQ